MRSLHHRYPNGNVNGYNNMQSEDERRKRSALIQTVLICAVAELALLLFLRVMRGTFAEAAFISFFLVGPASFWFAARLCRYLLRANQ